MLTIDTIPLKKFSILSLSLMTNQTYNLPQTYAANRKSLLFIFSMQRMNATTTTEFFEFKTTRSRFFILCRNVIALFALGALQNYVISRHNSYLNLIIQQFRRQFLLQPFCRLL